MAHHHDFDDAGGLILHERSPLNPKSIYATAKVAADFLTMNYHDAFGVPGVVTRMFNNYGPRQNPRYVTGTIITQALTRPQIELGALEPLRDFCFCTDGVRGHLTVAAHGVPGDVYVYGQGKNISMGDWVETDPARRPGERLLARRPGDRDHTVTAASGRDRRAGAPRRLRETARRDGLGAGGLVGTGRPAHDRVVRGEPRALDRPCRLAARQSPAAKTVTRILVTGGGGFVGSSPRRAAPRPTATRSSWPGARDYDLTSMTVYGEELFEDARPELVFHLAAEVGGIGANRANPGPLLVRKPRDGRARARAVQALTRSASS